MADLTNMLQAAAEAGSAPPPFNPRDYFNTVIWTGDGVGTSRSFTGVGFQPDLVWAKSRSGTRSNLLFDAVRGAGSNEELTTNNTTVEGGLNTAVDGFVASFDSDGFTADKGSSTFLYFNNNAETYVAWNWNAGGSNATNTDGTITSTVRANPTAGFSIVSYTGNSTGGATVGHGLGVTPAMLIVKGRTIAQNWLVYHQANTIAPATDFLYLNSTVGTNDSATAWNDTAPTSTVFSIGSSIQVNDTGDDYIAYCFAEIGGFSKFGSYTGNGSATGPSVTTDFEPTWLMIKRTDNTGDWILLDSARDATNPRDKYLRPNSSAAEATGNDVDFNSTGFQLKSTSASINASGGTYIYACFA